MQNRVRPISDVEADSSDNIEEKEEERPKPKVKAKPRSNCTSLILRMFTPSQTYLNFLCQQEKNNQLIT